MTDMLKDARGIRAILFDKDGTLLDYHATWMPANHAVARHYANGDDALYLTLMEAGGWQRESDRIAAGSPMAAASLHEIAALFQLHALYLRDIATETLAEEMDRLFIAHSAPSPVCDLGALFTRLQAKGLRLGVATADSEAGAKATLAAFDVLPRCDYVVGYDSGFGCKPGPGMVHGFCERLGISPSEVMVVGDNSHDLEMARAACAGLSVGVLTGTSKEAELAPLADWILPDIEGIEPRLTA